MTQWKILLLTILLSSSSFAQETSFPYAWVGSYSGNMLILFQGRPADTVPVTFELNELEKDSVWTYTMTYNSDKWGTIVKDYRYVATKKGDSIDFIFDELNGIVMELTLMNDCFYGMYEVMGTLYTTTFRRHGEQLFFELYGAPTDNPRISESEPDVDGSTITAKSMKPNLVQSVLLTRVAN